ncbi:MAG: type III toxin-antitoxin system ToxN/AbiQ family toxin [Lachnospiraceae bacterium]|nr:type III toxin-antitoxin system ToxN/AbiQ family toxin [Lachnospiraceae bacterium]
MTEKGFLMDRLEFYTVDLKYVKELYRHDREVFYDESTEDYGSKPYVGILVHTEGYRYFVPLTSAKKKHLNWKNVSRDNYLIYEMTAKEDMNSRHIFKEIQGTDIVKHILAVLEIKKMIPVKPGLYHKMDFSQIGDERYKTLLLKEYEFLKPLAEGIQCKAEKIYKDQKVTGVIHPFYCNFSLLESICDTYQETLS